MKKTKKANSIEGRIHLSQLQANNPCEDTYNAYQLNIKNKPVGYYMAVFDGHGGWQLSEFAKNKLHLYVEEMMKQNKPIKDSLVEAFDKLENEFLAFSRDAFSKGFAKAAYVGSCALVACVTDSNLYVANAGDSKGYLFRKEQNGSYSPIKLSHTFNANSKKEQKRMYAQFPLDDNIIVCRHPKACYVKNNLMCTRCFGDYYLKYKEFHEHSFSSIYGYRRPYPAFNGPYITHSPEIITIPLTKADKFILLGSDGLWDEISKEEAATIIKENAQHPEQISQKIIDYAISKIAQNHSMSVENLMKGNFGSIPRRSIHDDITVALMNLDEQV